MKKRLAAALLTAVFCVTALAACGGTGTDAKQEAGQDSEGSGDSENAGGSKEGASYKIGIVQFVDDASLNQIEKALEKGLDAKGEELGVTFVYDGYVSNGQADATVLNQIGADLVADDVDAIIAIATPAAQVMQAAVEDTDIPLIFSAVTDPVTAGLVEDLNEPGVNITGTSDALDTNAVFDLMFAASPDIKSVGLLYSKSEDASTRAIEEAKEYCKNKGVEVIEKTGTTNDEVSLGADALIAAGVDAVFTPTDNTVMKAELAIYEKFIDAKIPHYTGADSFALNGAFLGYGVNYEELGTATAQMAAEIVAGGADPAKTAVQMLDNGIATVNIETAEKIGLDYSMFSGMCETVKEITTAEEFE